MRKAADLGKGRYILPYTFLPLAALFEKDEERFEKVHRDYIVAKSVNANVKKLGGLLEGVRPRDMQEADAELLNNIGAAYWVKGDIASATRYFSAAISRDGQFAEALFNLAVAHYEAGRIARAVECLTSGERSYSMSRRILFVPWGSDKYIAIGDTFLIKRLRKGHLRNLYLLKTGSRNRPRIYSRLSNESIRGGDVSLGIKYGYDALHAGAGPEGYLNLAAILRKYKLFRLAKAILIEGLQEFPASTQIEKRLKELEKFQQESGAFDGDSAYQLPLFIFRHIHVIPEISHMIFRICSPVLYSIIFNKRNSMIFFTTNFI